MMARQKTKEAMNFIHLMERMSEPLGYGLRGGGTGTGDPRIYFFYPDDETMDRVHMEDQSMRRTVNMMKDYMREHQNGVQMIPVKIPAKMPNLELVKELCPRTGNFCYFHPRHRQAFIILKDIFMKQRNVSDLFDMACFCRDNPMINCQLYIYALSSCLVSRRDTRHIPIPSHVETMPESYCSNAVIRQAHKLSHMPEVPGQNGPKMNTTMPILIDGNVTGRGTDREQRLWYFREDILVNAHHFHWHVVFPVCSPKDPAAEGYRDRRGELFYYMHHSMVARYDAERLCNGLSRVKKIDFNNLMLEEGYFGKLSSENSGMQWGTRQANTRLTDIQTLVGNNPLGIRVEELIRWRDRILESIDIGYYVEKDPNTGKERRVPLDPIKGIDILGDIIENSASLTPHGQYYGTDGFHNMGHVLIACSHDPRGKFRESLGVMGDVSTAMRDPAFYRWHKYIDHMFNLYKLTLPPYPLKSNNKNDMPLLWNGIEVKSLTVKSRDSQQMNVLKTFWDYKDVDLARGLDFRRTASSTMNKNPNPVVGRFTHLNCGLFDYRLTILNKTGKRALSTIRIFMAPRHDENEDVFTFSEQRLQFFEMDKVAKLLEPGPNNIIISSRDSSVTLRDENGSSFEHLETIYREAKSMSDGVNESQCSCGWPSHLLLPRGTPGGTDYDVFVIVTDGSQDMLPDLNRKTGCNSALSFCGVLNQKYPDARPMGYPFDRAPYLVSAMDEMDFDPANQCPGTLVPVQTLEQYVSNIKNSTATKVKIIHEKRIMKKGDTALEQQMMMEDGKCFQFKEYYGTEQTSNVNNEKPDNWSHNNRHPERDRPQNFPPQWGGIGDHRDGRQAIADDGWEDLSYAN